jgi:hypothetical protein
MEAKLAESEKEIVSWGFILRGNDSDLALIQRIFTGVDDIWIEIISSQYNLRSSRFDVPATADEARRIAEEILAMVNGTMKVYYTSRQIVVLGNTFACFRDGTRSIYQYISASMRGEGLLNMGGDAPLPPEPLRWFKLAQQDPNVADALRQYTKSDDWFDIYNVYEIIRCALGNTASLNTRGWASGRKLDLLRQTANYYRHARTAPPSNPMPHVEARDLIRLILRRWLDEKGGT